MAYIKKHFILISAIIVFGLNLLFGYIPSFLDQFYSQFINKYMIIIISHITGWLPFSVAGVLILGFVGYVIYKLILWVRGKIQFDFVKLTKILLTIYILFMVMWGFNYQRQTIGSHMNLETVSVTQENLINVSEIIISEINLIRPQLNENENGHFKISTTHQKLFKRGYLGFDVVSKEHPVLGGNYGKTKPVLFSSLMIKTNIGGMYFPFTGEPNVNISGPDLFKPFAVLHEMAHQRSFAREDEANFIGYFVGIHHPDLDYQYSSLMLGLNYLLHDVRKTSPDYYTTLLDLINEDSKKDFDDYYAFFSDMKSIVTTVSHHINDVFLRLNQQKDGVLSYGGLTQWLVSYHTSILT